MKHALLAAFAILLLTAPASAEPPIDAKVNRTIANIRSLASAIETYAADHHGYPKVERFTDLLRELTPKYLVVGNEPFVDGWGFPFVYRATADGCHYRIVSGNADGAFAKPSLKMSPTPPKNATFMDSKSDIVYQDNAFRTLPAIVSDAFELHEKRTFICPKSGSR